MTAMHLILRSTTIWAGMLVCIFMMGGFLAWASLAPLAEGVIVYGNISVEHDRKVVQHLEGGIVQRVLVEEGGTVEKGDPLIVLADLAVTANRDQVALEMLNAHATTRRLEALLEGHPTVEFDELNLLETSPEKQAEIIQRQTDLFNQQLVAFNAELSVLRSRLSGLRTRTENLDNQIKNTVRAKNLIEEDIAHNTSLLEQRLIRSRELEELKRRAVDIQSEFIRLNAERDTSLSQATEVMQQISQHRAAFSEQISDDLVIANATLRSVEEKLVAADDIVNRTIIEAPQSGRILNLVYKTEGGVVGAGAPILEIIPETNGIVAIVEVRPVDRDAIMEGQIVETRLSGSNTWRTPLLSGVIEQISADIKTSPRGDYTYYEATIMIDADSAAMLSESPVPGMPVEAFVYSGNSRTFLDYLTAPIFETFRRGARD